MKPDSGQSEKVSTHALVSIPYRFVRDTTVSELVVIDHIDYYDGVSVEVQGCAVGPSEVSIASYTQVSEGTRKSSGTLVIDNVTKGSSVTFIFNNSSRSSPPVNIPSDWAVGDSVKFTVDYTPKAN